MVYGGILRPGIGPEGIRIWRSTSFSFNFYNREKSDIINIINPLINGDEKSAGQITITYSSNEVKVNFETGPRTPLNGSYRLKKYP